MKQPARPPPPTADHSPSRRPWRRPQRCLRPGCRGYLSIQRDGDYVTITCPSCGTGTKDHYAPRTRRNEIEKQKALEAVPLVEEPQLTQELEKSCDLRRRGHDDEGIWNRTGWPECYRDLLLEEAMRRDMKGTDENADAAFREWQLEMHDSGIGMRHICRLSGRSESETRQKLTEAFEAAHYAELERWTTWQENCAEAEADADGP